MGPMASHIGTFCHQVDYPEGPSTQALGAGDLGSNHAVQVSGTYMIVGCLDPSD